jgi:uncharacterized GH25 family protein
MRHNGNLCLALALLLAAAGLAQAHDLKALASQQHLSAKDGQVTVYLSWGHALPVDDLIDGATLLDYKVLSPSGKDMALKISDLSLQANSVAVEEAGIHQVIAIRKPAILTYVIDEEGNKVMKKGPKSGVTGGKVDYGFRSQQFAKALIVKEPAGKSKVKAVGLPLEIVPLAAPEEWRKGTALAFQVLYHGKPLAGEQVLATYVGFRPNNAWCYATTTSKQGIATVLPQQAGTWVLRVQVRQPADAKVKDQYDYENLTSTLTLEILP